MNKYIIIDAMENKTYRYDSPIVMGYHLDCILETRNNLEIPYKLTYYNNYKIISIRAI
jgi:hypothetical protein